MLFSRFGCVGFYGIPLIAGNLMSNQVNTYILNIYIKYTYILNIYIKYTYILNIYIKYIY